MQIWLASQTYRWSFCCLLGKHICIQPSTPAPEAISEAGTPSPNHVASTPMDHLPGCSSRLEQIWDSLQTSSSFDAQINKPVHPAGAHRGPPVLKSCFHSSGDILSPEEVHPPLFVPASLPFRGTPYPGRETAGSTSPAWQPIPQRNG